MAFTDWHGAFRKVLAHTRPANCLEFGVGDGTRLLLDHCDHVTSHELLANPDLEEWIEKAGSLYESEPNWHFEVFRCKDEWSDSLKAHISEVVSASPWDLIFVDPGVHCRGEIVNECFNHAPIIAAHDTNNAPERYGWVRIVVPENYQVWRNGDGEGTTFWFSDPELLKKVLES